jgi:hypothetical protein
VPDRSLSLLNVFEVEHDGTTRHVVCFLDSVLAGARGIDSRSVIGEFTPGPGGEFDLASFRLNPEFVEAFTHYMNGEASRDPAIVAQARQHASGWLYLVDPRSPDDPDSDPPPSDLVGCFAVDADGQVVPNSFQYNRNHLWFDPLSGVSGLLSDRRFYNWLHPMPG